ncbi:hypothetical protein ACFRCX_30160 [Streptomyces sp. NPDC056652]|uniref:hypothetical protein n=1 Tax=Streptomyces sp. NPDC056652 TaxID=3345893 RepID=UPI003676E10C
MALRPDDQQRRDNLVAAANTLRTTGHPDLAGAVDYVLSPLGPDFLARLNPAAVVSSNLPIKMTEERRALINEGAGKEAKLRRETVRIVLAKIVDEGFARWLAGDFEPRWEPKAGRGAGPKLVILNTHPNADLHAKVAACCRELKGDRFAPGRNVYPGNVAAYALFAYFGIGPYAPDAVTAG